MKRQMKKTGFTLVELLTVMSIIAILIGILVPALSAVKKVAKDVSQNAQLHSITVALDLFQGENGSYPESTVQPTVDSEPGNAPYTVGAQHLAEALIGRDMLGFDPMTTWNAEDDKAVETIYASKDIKNSTIDEERASIARRKGPYLNQQNTEAYEIGQLYTDALKGGNVYNSLVSSPNSPAPVLTDCFRTKNIIIGDKTVMAGSPILYYKANTSAPGTTEHPEWVFPADSVTTFTDALKYGYIYNHVDNEFLIDLGTIKNQDTLHHYESTGAYTENGKNGIRLFYDAIKNPKIVSQPRPYNADTYILISAGYDGIYGTKDDIKNFGE